VSPDDYIVTIKDCKKKYGLLPFGQTDHLKNVAIRCGGRLFVHAGCISPDTAA
jgi:hypothetical protein